MTNLIGILAVPAVIGAYIFASKHLTKFMMDGGKSPTQIIKAHQTDSKKRSLIKYPEADIRRSKHIILALGFIFAFATSIFAFSIIGEGQKKYEFGDNPVEDGGFEILSPRIVMEEKVIEKKEIPKKLLNPDIIIDDKAPELKKEAKEIVVSTKTGILSTIGEIDTGEEEVDEKEFHLIVGQMPRFKNCESLSEEEAIICTNNRIQSYVRNMEIPEIILDNDLGGMVYVRFIVGKDGGIEELSIVRGANDLLDKAVLNHLKGLPNFASAGEQMGKKVRVQYIIPVNIVLE